MATPPSDDLHIRVPRKLKHSVQKVLESNGMDISSAVRLFFTHISVRGTLPLPWLTINGFTPEFEESLLRQIRNPDIVATLKTPTDVKKYFDAL